MPNGATGGGFILSKGAVTTAWAAPDHELGLVTTVNGDPEYDARTTRRAVQLFLDRIPPSPDRIKLEQKVDTPIGAGFGASGASATSAVYAVAAAAKINMTREELALYAHRAEIIEQTGLGTVSVVFNSVGAGAIIAPGEPGKAKFVNVKVPEDARLVTAYVAPYDKREALSSKALRKRISSLGHAALATFLSDPTFETLLREGERFSSELGLESPEVRKLIRLAKSAGATGASQNMIGYSVHAVVPEDSSAKVVRALRSLGSLVRVDTFDIGTRRAGLLATSRMSRAPG